MIYSRLALIALIFSTASQADYSQSGNTLTFDDQWWQVENAWPATGIVCSGNSGEDCTLSAGQYKWLGSSGEGRISISGATSAPLTAALEIIYQPATETEVYTGGDIQTRVIPCPADTVIIGGSCLFESGYGPSSDGSIYPMQSEQSFDGNALRCTILGSGYNTLRYLATFTGTAACAVATSTTLPVIEIR